VQKIEAKGSARRKMKARERESESFDDSKPYHFRMLEVDEQ
jgi:hypothetical protein